MGQPANLGSPGKWQLRQCVSVSVCVDDVDGGCVSESDKTAAAAAAAADYDDDDDDDGRITGDVVTDDLTSQ